MKSRMEKYYKDDEDTTRRSEKNKSLYKSMYDEFDYNNIEEILNIKKNEGIDLNKIKELVSKPEVKKKAIPVDEEIEIYEEKNYDINDVLSKAREDKPLPNTRYDMTQNTEINDDSINIEELIETLTIQEEQLQKTVQVEKEIDEQKDMDKSFYTESMGFKNNDFDLENGVVPKKSKLTIVLVIILILAILAVIGLVVFAFLNGYFE